MFRVFLSIAFLVYCSSLPLTGSSFQRSIPIVANDDSDIVDNTGAGYSYFIRQEIETRPSDRLTNSIPSKDFSGQIRTDTFPQQLPMSNSNLRLQTLPSQRDFLQQDFSQLDLPVSTGFPTQQSNVQFQSSHPIQNTLNSLPKQDLKTINSLQILLPRTNLNTPFKTLTSTNSQQHTFIIPPKLQSTWSTIQRSTGINSIVNGPNQQPITSSFLIQSNQQNDKVPVTNALVVLPPLPHRRILAQSQSTRFVPTNV